MIILYTTCPTKKEAERIARALLKKHLVACVNLWPVRSVYRWKGKIAQASEWALWCKTRRALATRVERRIRALHSYDMPVIERWEVKASKSVEQWLKDTSP